MEQSLKKLEVKYARETEMEKIELISQIKYKGENDRNLEQSLEETKTRDVIPFTPLSQLICLEISSHLFST